MPGDTGGVVVVVVSEEKPRTYKEVTGLFGATVVARSTTSWTQQCSALRCKT